MLTGDKLETATCIAISAGYKDRRQQIFSMRNFESVREAELKLADFEQKTNTLLMIDG
jgi:phospholipid-translocating ATPase